jgi:hypothetical protein
MGQSFKKNRNTEHIIHALRTATNVNAELLLHVLEEVLQQAGELHREDVLGGGAGADRFKRLEVLQGHGLLVDQLGAGEDIIQGLAKPSARELCLAIALSTQDVALLSPSAQDGALLLTIGHIDGGFTRTG